MSRLNRFPRVAAIALGASLAAPLVAAPPVSLESLLHEMTDRDRVARWPDPAYACLQASSYDRASKDPADAKTWFANADVDQYIREETHALPGTPAGRKEWVMMDAPGPGAIVRIWSANPKGTLRIYLDDSDTPAIEAPMSDVLGGKWKVPAELSYEASKGWNLYLPIPYAKHCKVTSDQRGFYYHVNYRTYQPGTPVTTYTTEQLVASSQLVADTAKELIAERVAMPRAGEQGFMTGGSEPSGKVAPGGAISIDLPAGSFAITGMAVSLQSDDLAQATRSCVVEAAFDGEQTIWCPVGDFFGSGVGANTFQDWYRGVQPDGLMRAAWVMPYARSGKLTVRNLSDKPVGIQLRARAKPWNWDDRSMHFHAVWRQKYPVKAQGSRGTEDWNYVDVSGKGVYVGDVLSVMNPVKDWWGEGDEKIYVDGEKFPSHFGTGTEDYYGYAWCWPAVFAKPFHAQTRCDGERGTISGEGGNNWGRTTVTRTRSLDAIPFTKSLSMNIEVWHWKACDEEYATTAYYYALPGSTSNRSPSPEAAAAKLVDAPPLPPPKKIAGAIECESLKPSATSPGILVEAQGGFGPELWSGSKQLWVRAKKPGDFVELAWPASQPGRYRVTLHATRSWDYGIVRFSLNGKKAGDDVDLYSGGHEVQATGPIDLGTAEAMDGKILLRCELVGGNPKAEGDKSFFGLDCVVIEAVR